MDYEGLIDDNRVLIACSMNYETAVTFTYGHFNKVVFAVYSLITDSKQQQTLLLTACMAMVCVLWQTVEPIDSPIVPSSYIHHSVYVHMVSMSFQNLKEENDLAEHIY